MHSTQCVKRRTAEPGLRYRDGKSGARALALPKFNENLRIKAAAGHRTFKDWIISKEVGVKAVALRNLRKNY
jgi:hypothetical protein